MKPSERIEEIRQQLNEKDELNGPAYIMLAILTYLDEEYEKNQARIEQLKKDLQPM